MFEFMKANNVNQASFEEERYLSQEYYKIILNQDAKTYFENGLELMALFEDVLNRSLSRCMLDVFAEE
jgi:hypothetical protein